MKVVIENEIGDFALKQKKRTLAAQAEHAIEKLRTIARRAEARQADDDAMQAVRAAASLQYTYNQWYVDEESEAILQRIAGRLPVPGYQKDAADAKTVLFYDSFGLDTRGLACIYLKALADLGCHVIYLTQKHARGAQPQIQKETRQGDVTFLYLPQRLSLLEKAKRIAATFEEHRPAHAFFYCTPDDVAACVAFDRYEGSVVRYQINLTDHAFWLGKYAMDICLEFRDYGAAVSAQYRGIPQEKLQCLPYYPYADLDMAYAGLPFEVDGRRVLFSGGSLYKTVGDGGRYIEMVRTLLAQEPELVFLYAGGGNAQGAAAIAGLAQAFPGRVYHIAERRDLFQLMEHVDLYLNTYPMLGGLMTQYAARAGRPPLTLRPVGQTGRSLEGFLLHPKRITAEFDTIEELAAEAHHLLHDAAYAAEAAERARAEVISPEGFQAMVARLLEEGVTGYPLHVEPVDTQSFRAEYIGRLRQSDIDCVVFAPRKGWKLARQFPAAGVRRVLRKLHVLPKN